MATEAPRKLKVLALHGSRTSGAILKKQVSKWSPAIHDLIDFTFLDGPTPAQGESDVQHIYEGPYFEWMQSNKDYTEFYNYRESIAFVIDYVEKNGPFDGLLGFSQGATLAGCIVALQRRKWDILGKSAADLPPIRFFIAISGANLRDPGINDVYLGTPMDVPTLHLIGAKDFMCEPSTQFLQFWKDPVTIKHPQGHTVPRLDEAAVTTFVTFLKQVQTAQPGAADDSAEK
ncbi:hypothetical protein Mapa_009795 [Marchantia paleacea]|nr:hypothetical protein Mapa_009795 [Marchantia paleacea]